MEVHSKQLHPYVHIALVVVEIIKTCYYAALYATETWRARAWIWPISGLQCMKKSRTGANRSPAWDLFAWIKSIRNYLKLNLKLHFNKFFLFVCTCMYCMPFKLNNSCCYKYININSSLWCKRLHPSSPLQYFCLHLPASLIPVSFHMLFKKHFFVPSLFVCLFFPYSC